MRKEVAGSGLLLAVDYILTAETCVSAFTTVERVDTTVSEQGVVPSIGDYVIVTVTAAQQIVARTPGDDVATGEALHLVVACVPE